AGRAATLANVGRAGAMQTSEGPVQRTCSAGRTCTCGCGGNHEAKDEPDVLGPLSVARRATATGRAEELGALATGTPGRGAARERAGRDGPLPGRPKSLMPAELLVLQRDRGSHDWKAGYEDGLAGNQGTGAPRDGAALDDYTEGAKQGSYEAEQKQASSAQP